MKQSCWNVSFYSSQTICNRLYLRLHLYFININMSRQHNKVVSCDTIDLSRYGDMLPQHQLWITNNAMHAAAYLPLKQPAHIYHNNPHIHRFVWDLPSAIVRINTPISFSQRPAVDRFAHKIQTYGNRKSTNCFIEISITASQCVCVCVRANDRES